ncbi:MAG: TonB-dependent receptor [Bacteroidales bacterium]|nr:TonB-dependent receptor [Bacteroidales bacterium]
MEKTLKVFLVLLLGCLSYQSLPAQTLTVKGIVTDIHEEPVPGANILVKGTTTGTFTDIDGRYSLETDATSILVFSSIGFLDKIVKVDGRNVLDVMLESDTESLEETVVVAYGTASKTSITGALSSVTTDDLLKSPTASVTNMLAGSMPGVASVQTSGQPGKDAATIYIRGNGSLNNSLASPLILVDGIERDFSQIDPNEIESISILKDASSTAVFGVRGANGVILVTTRRGSSGKPLISVSTSAGLQQPISLVEQTGSYEFARFWNIKQKMDGVTNPKLLFTREAVEAYRTGSDPIMYPSMDWQEYCFRDVFMQSKNNINISGGNENVKYFISVGYLYQNGLLKQMPGQEYDNNYRYNRYNYRANIDARLTPTTTMKLGIGGVAGKTQEPRNVVSDTNQDQNPWVISQIWTHPFAGPGFIDGVRTVVPKDLVPLGEILRDGMFVFYGCGYTLNYSTSLNLDIDIDQDLKFITEGLSAGIKGAYDSSFRLNKKFTGGAVEYQTAYYKSYFDTNGQMAQTDPDYDKSIIYVPTGNDTPLSYSESYGRSQNWYLEARIRYDRSFGYHKVGGLILYNQSRNYYPSTYTYIPRSYAGLVGRVTYSYMTRYLLDLNVGYNGSENFAPGKTRFGLFPSFSAGWVLSGEDFMSRQKVFSYLKLRASWGLVGSDKGLNTRFMYMPAVWSGSGSYSFGVDNPDGAPAASVSRLGNDLVTWETAAKTNVGIDAKFLDSRLSLVADWFFEDRKGILITPESTPAIIATKSPDLNIGEVINRGYEIALSWNDTAAGSFSYFINANMSFARNKILNMDEVPKKYDYMNETGGSTDRHTGLYRYIRLYQYEDFITNSDGSLTLKPEFPQPYQQVFPGDAMYADLNGDNRIDGDDRHVTGYSTRPEYIFGLNTGFNWKGLSFNMQWTAAANVNKILDIEYRIPFTNAGKRGLLSYFYEGCWTPENQQDAIYPRPAETSESWNSEDSTLWLMDSSYIRLKDITLGYTFSGQGWLGKVGISSLGFTFSGYNLVTFSPLKLIDPEGQTTRMGDYPLVKLYSLGLNINF